MDKRKENGGHSTKAKGVDKRKNNYKAAIEEAFSSADVVKVLTSMKTQAISDGDIQAAKVFLEYTAGKPMQQMDITSDGDKVQLNMLMLGAGVSPDKE